MPSSLVYLSILLFAFCLNISDGQPSFPSTANSGNTVGATGGHQNTLLAELESESNDDNGDSVGLDDGSNYDKRVERYAFGLGRRAYTYPMGGNGIKRLPVYNFGLGKRARPYSFGLGKRSEYRDELYGDNGDLEQALNAAYLDEKRNRPYSFGLGKRDPNEEVDRRGYPNRYGFGLGR